MDIATIAAISAAAGSIIGILAKAGLDYYREKTKAEQTERAEEHELVVKVYGAAVDSLTERLSTVERKEQECRNEQMAQALIIGEMRGEMDSLRTMVTVQQLPTTISSLMSLDLAVMVIDEKSTIHSFSPACSKIFGWTSGELLGRSVEVLIFDEEETKDHQAKINRYIHTGEGNIIGKGRVVKGKRKDESPVWVELSVAPLRPMFSDRFLFVGSFRETTNPAVETPI